MASSPLRLFFPAMAVTTTVIFTAATAGLISEITVAGVNFLTKAITADLT